MKTYNGEFIQAEPGETDDDEFYTSSMQEVLQKVRQMKDGDTLVINCTER